MLNQISISQPVNFKGIKVNKFFIADVEHKKIPHSYIFREDQNNIEFRSTENGEKIIASHLIERKIPFYSDSSNAVKDIDALLDPPKGWKASVKLNEYV